VIGLWLLLTLLFLRDIKLVMGLKTLIKKLTNHYIFNQRYKWFVFLINLKARYKNSDAVFSYISNERHYHLGSKNINESRSILFKHVLQGGVTYIEGIYQRDTALFKNNIDRI